jgi:hypothetical protein
LGIKADFAKAFRYRKSFALWEKHRGIEICQDLRRPPPPSSQCGQPVESKLH